MEQFPCSSREDRKTIEKNRRNHMKSLYSKLNSVIPHQVTREPLSLLGQLERAENYIKELQTNIDKMKQKKERLMEVSQKLSCNGGSAAALSLPQIEIHANGPTLEVVLITLMDCQFIFNETIRILHEEGADVIHASFSLLDNFVFHTIHSKVGGDPPEHSARISERLRKFVSGAR